MKVTASILLKVCLEVSAWEYADQVTIDRAAEICVEVAQEAQAQSQPVDYLIALAWEESRFQTGILAKSKHRRKHESNRDWQYRKRWRIAQGPLQVIPWWHCSEFRKTDNVEQCDLIAAGVSAFKRFSAYTSSNEETVCYYNCYHPLKVNEKGERVKRPCSKESKSWSKVVTSVAKRVNTIIRRYEAHQTNR